MVSISHEAEANITRILHDVRRESQTDDPTTSRDSWLQQQEQSQNQSPSISWTSNPSPSMSWGSEGACGGVGQSYKQETKLPLVDMEAVHHRLGQVHM